MFFKFLILCLGLLPTVFASEPYQLSGNEKPEWFLARNIAWRDGFIISSGSMRPMLLIGDTIYLAIHHPYTKLRVGDIVLFKPNGAVAGTPPVCHRIRMRHPKWADAWVTQGDANSNEDFPLLPENYLGKVMAMYRPR